MFLLATRVTDRQSTLRFREERCDLYSDEGGLPGFFLRRLRYHYSFIFPKRGMSPPLCTQGRMNKRGRRPRSNLQHRSRQPSSSQGEAFYPPTYSTPSSSSSSTSFVPLPRTHNKLGRPPPLPPLFPTLPSIPRELPLPIALGALPGLFAASGVGPDGKMGRGGKKRGEFPFVSLPLSPREGQGARPVFVYLL